MNLKVELTKKILEILNLDSSQQNIQKIIPVWWYSTRKKSTGGLQLTSVGFEAFIQADIKNYKIKFLEPIVLSNKLVLWLDNYIDCPFYLRSKEVYVFSEKTAVQLMLFSGNIQKFTEARATRAQLDKIQAL